MLLRRGALLFFKVIRQISRSHGTKNRWFWPKLGVSGLSVCYTFLTMFLSSYHPEIFRCYYHWQTWCPWKRSRSKVKVTKVMTPFGGFRTVTPAWIHIWWWNDAQSLMLLRKRCPIVFQGHPSNFEVTRDKKSSILTQIGRFRIVTPVEFTNGFEMMHKAWCCLGEVPYCFLRSSVKLQGHTAKKNRRFWPKLGVSGL